MAGALRKTMAYLGLSEEDDTQFQEPTAPVRNEPPRPVEREAQVTPMPRPTIAPAPEPAADLRRISTVHPTTYNEARAIGEAFRDGTPVIMNLSGMSETEAKRMVDFAAGLVFGLHGTIERVTSRVFLLSPADVEIAGDTEAETGPGRLFNQS